MNEQVIKFGTNKKFLVDTSVAIEIQPPSTDPELLAALVNNTAFPLRPIKLGNISVRADAGKNIAFSGNQGKVTFKASGGAFTGLGVYPDPKDLITDLKLDENIAPGLVISPDPDQTFLMLRWGYDLSASAKGSIALGAIPGSVNFGASASREAVYAVIRSLKNTTGARTAIQKTVGSWILPTHVNDLNDFAPGTWLIAEVDGSFAANIGLQFGYDFNWVREAKLGELVGDIGLHIETAVSASLGFSASGNFALVLGRESLDANDGHVRLRLYKLKKRGWNFAFNASANVQADFSDFLKSDFDGFIKAVLGIHGQQIVKTLETLDKWTDPAQPLPELLSGLAVDSAFDLLKKTTGIDPAVEFEKARKAFLGLLKQWNDLDHRVATTIWKLIEEKVDLAPVRDVLNQIATGNQDTVKAFLAPHLSKVDFFTTPIGRLLIAAAEKGILTPLVDTQEFKKFQVLATKAGSILDGSIVEDALTKLQTFINQKLNIAAIEKIATETDFQKIDGWLKARLEAFLGETIDFAKVEKIRTTIHILLDKRNEFFNKTKEALNRKYTFAVNTTYQSTTTQTALLDIVFDLNQASAGAALQAAVGGKFDEILVKQQPGVAIKTAVLTHQIERKSHVNIDLPFFKSTVDHINTALARVKAMDEDDGRVLVFELEADDVVTSKNKSLSRLSIAGSFPVTAGNQVRIHSQSSLSGSYAFRQVRRNMKRAELEFQLKPYVDIYFPRAFGDQQNPDAKGTFINLIGEMDKTIDQIEFNGTDVFGNTLISIEVAFSAEMAAAWFKAPGDDNAPEYMNMSRNLQAKLRQLIPFYFFQDVRNYGTLMSAMALMVYAAMPVTTSVEMKDSETVKRFNTDKDIHWDWVDRATRNAVVFSAPTKRNLIVEMARVERLLRDTGMGGKADFYTPNQLSKILNTVTKDIGENNLKSLLFVEAELVKGAVGAGIEIAKFIRNAGVKPSIAIEALATFGAKLTKTFNNQIESIYGGDGVRPLGSLALVEAARALDPMLTFEAPAAILEMIVIKEQSSFSLPEFLNGKLPAKEDIVIEQRLLNLD
jgi:hypothetical protein